MSNIQQKHPTSSLLIGSEKNVVRKVIIDGVPYFHAIDCVYVLTQSENPRVYWKWIKKEKLLQNHNGNNITRVKTKGKDNKYYFADFLTYEQVLHLTTVIPSPNVAPFKAALAELASAFIKQKIKTKTIPAHNRQFSKEKRKKYTDILKDHKAAWDHDKWYYKHLTDEGYKWTGFNSVKSLEKYKNLNKKDSLRDNMSAIELSLVTIQEEVATELIKENNPVGYAEVKPFVTISSDITKTMKNTIESATGKKVITSNNNKKLLSDKKK